MNKRLTFLLITLAISLTACATSTRDMFPLDTNKTIKKTWDAKTSGSSCPGERCSPVARLSDGVSTSLRELNPQAIERLANPDLHMYVFPHLNGEAWVPGYTTTFPMYSVVKYK